MKQLALETAAFFKTLVENDVPPAFAVQLAGSFLQANIISSRAGAPTPGVQQA